MPCHCRGDNQLQPACARIVLLHKKGSAYSEVAWGTSPESSVALPGVVVYVYPVVLSPQSWDLDRNDQARPEQPQLSIMVLDISYVRSTCAM